MSTILLSTCTKIRNGKQTRETVLIGFPCLLFFFFFFSIGSISVEREKKSLTHSNRYTHTRFKVWLFFIIFLFLRLRLEIKTKQDIMDENLSRDDLVPTRRRKCTVKHGSDRFAQMYKL